jgi:hypothetical protein
VLFVPRVGVRRRLLRPPFVWTPAATPSSTALAASAAHRPLKPGAWLFRNTGAGGQGLGELRRGQRVVRAFSSIDLFFRGIGHMPIQMLGR